MSSAPARKRRQVIRTRDQEVSGSGTVFVVFTYVSSCVLLEAKKNKKREHHHDELEPFEGSQV